MSMNRFAAEALLDLYDASLLDVGRGDGLPGESRKQAWQEKRDRLMWQEKRDRLIDRLCATAADSDSEAMRMFLRLNNAIDKVLVDYVGGQPEQIRLRSRDLLHMDVDVGKLMLAMSGVWADIVRKIDADEIERKSRTLFATRSMEDDPKPLLVKKDAAPEAEPIVEAQKG